jgi:hypothetical protein
MTPSSLARILEHDSGVDAAYRHGPKRAVSRDPIETSRATLKWYDLHRDDAPVPGAIELLARECIAETPLEVPGMGFVILHRCGTDFYFLIACTWRNSNELWTTVFYKDGDRMDAFALFPRDDTHKPCFCVWELVPVWHETQSWARFIGTTRDAAAAVAWLADRYSGPA